MSRRPWIPIYVADYLAETTHLSPAEHGAYVLLMLDYWRNGALPKDRTQLARIVRMSPKDWTKVSFTIAALFGPGWTHPRLDSEIRKAAEISDAKRRAVAQRLYRPLRVFQSHDQSVDRSGDQSSANPLHTSHCTHRKGPIQRDEISQREEKEEQEAKDDVIVVDVFNARGAA